MGRSSPCDPLRDWQVVRFRAVTSGYYVGMPTVQELQDAWNEACRVERATWDRVKDKVPGTTSFDDELWEEWRDALDALDAARHELMQALKEPHRK